MSKDIKFEPVSDDEPSLAFTCRTCLNTHADQQLTSIFDDAKASGELNLFDQLVMLQLKIVKDDRYPAKICNICRNQLEAIDAFRKQCEKAQEYLEQKLINGNFPKDEPKTEPEILICSVEVSNDCAIKESPDDDKDQDYLDVETDNEDLSLENVPGHEKSSSDEEEAFEEHNTDKQNEKFKCPVCNKVFRSVAIKNDHLYLHSDVKGFSCSECDRSFKTKRYLRKHKASVHTFGDHECATCGMKFTKTSKYQNHLKSHKLTVRNIKEYKCSHCGRIFDHRNHWKSHELTHTRKRSHLCSICGKSFIHDSSLKTHLKIHNAAGEKYTCDMCNKTFSRKGSLKAHIDGHLNKRTYQCEQCGIKFTQQSTLKGHMKLHNAERTHHCEYCQESFLRIRDLRRHRLLIHNRTEVINRKNQQSRPANDESFVNTPIKQEDSTSKKRRKRPIEDKPYSCELCAKSFTIPTALENHVKIHSEDRQYVCKECDYAFKNIVHLQNHVNAVHMKRKPYSCEICQKSFARVGDRNLHRQMHSAGKSHQCSDCGKRFTWARSLQTHIREHTGEKPYVCIICSASFARQDYLARHTRIAHNDVQMNTLKRSDDLGQSAL